VLTSGINNVQLQKLLKGVAKQIFKFRSTRNGTRVIIEDMVDYQSVKAHFQTNNPKSQNPIKTVIHHLPQNTPAENIHDELVDLGFDVINFK
jgi:hypothetical protein